MYNLRSLQLPPFVKIVDIDKFKDQRLYDESVAQVSDIFYIELFCLFQRALNLNYDIYYITTTHNHNIQFSLKELEILNTPQKTWNYINNKEDEPIDFSIYPNITNIQNYQISDLNFLNKLSFVDREILDPQNNIGLFLTIPKHTNGYYSFDIFFISKKLFDINILLKHNFKTIKIINYNQFNSNTLDINFFKKICDIESYQFKNNFISLEEGNSLWLDKDIILPEKIAWKKAIDLHLSSEEKKIGIDKYNEIIIDVERLSSILAEKRQEYFDLQKCFYIYFRGLCTKFFVYDEILFNEIHFFTNFLELVHGARVTTQDNGELSLDQVHVFNIADMLDNDYWASYINHTYFYNHKKGYSLQEFERRLKNREFVFLSKKK